MSLSSHIPKLKGVYKLDDFQQRMTRLEGTLAVECEEQFEIAMRDSILRDTSDKISFQLGPKKGEEPNNVSEARAIDKATDIGVNRLYEELASSNFDIIEVNYIFPPSFFCTSQAMGNRMICRLVKESANPVEGNISPLGSITFEWTYGNHGHGYIHINWKNHTEAFITYRTPLFHNGTVCSRYEFACTIYYTTSHPDQSILIEGKPRPQKLITGFEERQGLSTVDIRDSAHFRAVVAVGKNVYFSTDCEDHQEDIERIHQVLMAQEKISQDAICGPHQEIDRLMEVKDWGKVNPFLNSLGQKSEYEICREIHRQKGGRSIIVNLDYPVPNSGMLTIKKPDRLSFSPKEGGHSCKTFNTPLLTLETAGKLVMQEFENFLTTITSASQA